MTCTIIEQECDESNKPVGLGQEMPVFVMDAGMGNWSVFYMPLAEKLKRITRICLIDRPGYLKPASGKIQRDARSIATEMKRELERNGVRGPVILVGHSLGGLHVRMYQHLFPEKVTGIVLLDSAHPRLCEELPQVRVNLQKQIKLVKLLIMFGKLRLLQFAKNKIPLFGLPPNLHRQYYAITTGAKYYLTYRLEMEAFNTSLEQCKALGSLGNLPLLVISSPSGLNEPIQHTPALKIDEDKNWFRLQKVFCCLSSRVTFIKSQGDHFLQLTDTATVAGAMKEFYRQVVCKEPAEVMLAE